MHLTTNLHSYLAIAKTAHAAAQDALAASQRLAPDGKTVIVTLDPDQRSFRQSLIAIVFACVYLEALLYIRGTERLGDDYDERAIYEKKLKDLGVDDTELLTRVENLRRVRKSIVHEKAAALCDIELSFPAQHEATKAIELVEHVTRALERRNSALALDGVSLASDHPESPTVAAIA